MNKKSRKTDLFVGDNDEGHRSETLISEDLVQLVERLWQPLLVRRVDNVHEHMCVLDKVAPEVLLLSTHCGRIITNLQSKEMHISHQAHAITDDDSTLDFTCFKEKFKNHKFILFNLISSAESSLDVTKTCKITLCHTWLLDV